MIAFGTTETAKPSTPSRNRLQRTIVYAIRPCRTLIEPGTMLRAAFACYIVQKPASGKCRVTSHNATSGPRQWESVLAHTGPL